MKRQYSYSRRNLFNQCKKAFAFRYLDKVPERKTVALEVGNLVHEFQKRYTRHLYTSQRFSDFDSGRRFMQDILADATPEAREDAAGIITALLERTYAWDTKEYVQIEQRWAFDPDWTPVSGLTDDQVWFHTDPKDIRFRMIMDLMYFENEKLWIHDYKTNRRVMSQSEVASDDQLPIYAFAASLVYPEIERIVLTLDFVRYDFQRQVELDVAEAREMQAILDQSMERMDAESEYPPEPGSYCDWCPFTKICPAFQTNTSEESLHITMNRPAPIETMEEAQEAAARMKHFEIAASALKERLKIFVEQFGSVPVGDQELGYVPVTKTSVRDTTEAVTAFLQAGMENQTILNHLSFTKTNFTKLVKKTEAPKDTFNPLLEENLETHFKFTKSQE